MFRRAIVLSGGIALLTFALGTSVAGGALDRPSPTIGAPVGSQVVLSFGVPGGAGKFFQLDHRVPRRVTGIPGRVVYVATSNSDSYALTAAGQVWAWGAGGKGELGNGRRAAVSVAPVRVSFPAGVRIAALANPMPYDSGIAIAQDGSVWGWGYNSFHSLCLPKPVVLEPKRIPLSAVTLASGAGGHALFYSRGRVYACGLGSHGELGNGSFAKQTRPVAVVDLPHLPVQALVSSWQGSGALLTDGRYYDWGYNALGQLGDGSRKDSSLPVRVRLPGRVTDVFQGGSTRHNGQSVAILANGSVWSWGSNWAGQLGDGTTTLSTVPVRVDLPSGHLWTQVCSAGYSSYAIDAGGRLFAWGGNNYGQLGDGGHQRAVLTPVAVGLDLTAMSGTATNVSALATARFLPTR